MGNKLTDCTKPPDDSVHSETFRNSRTSPDMPSSLPKPTTNEKIKENDDSSNQATAHFVSDSHCDPTNKQVDNENDEKDSPEQQDAKEIEEENALIQP